MPPAPKGWNPHKAGNTRRAIKAEKRVAAGYRRRGWKVERAGWGSDFVCTRGGRKIWAEVKVGDGRISDKQRRKMNAVGHKNYKVHKFTSDLKRL